MVCANYKTIIVGHRLLTSIRVRFSHYPLKIKTMDEFDKHLIKLRAIDKTHAQLINAQFAVEDSKRDLKDGLYGGVTRREQELIFEGYKTEVLVFKYILNELTKTTTNI